VTVIDVVAETVKSPSLLGPIILTISLRQHLSQEFDPTGEGRSWHDVKKDKKWMTFLHRLVDRFPVIPLGLFYD